MIEISGYVCQFMKTRIVIRKPSMCNCHGKAVADPVFSRGGAPTPGGGQHTIFAKFSPKQHEIVRFWTRDGASLPHEGGPNWIRQS